MKKYVLLDTSFLGTVTSTRTDAFCPSGWDGTGFGLQVYTEECTRWSSVAFSRRMYFSDGSLARGWTVTEPPNSFLWYEGWLVARVCEAGCAGSSWDMVQRGALSGLRILVRPLVLDRVRPLTELTLWRSTSRFQRSALSQRGVFATMGDKLTL